MYCVPKVWLLRVFYVIVLCGSIQNICTERPLASFVPLQSVVAIDSFESLCQRSPKRCTLLNTLQSLYANLAYYIWEVNMWYDDSAKTTDFGKF